MIHYELYQGFVDELTDVVKRMNEAVKKKEMYACYLCGGSFVKPYASELKFTESTVFLCPNCTRRLRDSNGNWPRTW